MFKFRVVNIVGVICRAITRNGGNLSRKTNISPRIKLNQNLGAAHEPALP